MYKNSKNIFIVIILSLASIVFYNLVLLIIPSNEKEEVKCKEESLSLYQNWQGNLEKEYQERNNFHKTSGIIIEQQEDGYIVINPNPAYISKVKIKKPRYKVNNDSCFLEFQYGEFMKPNSPEEFISLTRTIIQDVRKKDILAEIYWLSGSYVGYFRGEKMSDDTTINPTAIEKIRGDIKQRFLKIEKDIFGNNNYIPKFDQFQES
ncbi:MAG: hypothetical protein FD167_1416 [bacterium]|nr:MAG: hypothetical protein FD167_1416 [bacterium]